MIQFVPILLPLFYKRIFLFQVRVLFCNPTRTSMVPCPYFLDGKCKFGADECKYSHGHVVAVSELFEFKDPDHR